MKKEKNSAPKASASKNTDTSHSDADEIARLKVAHQEKIDELEAHRLAEMRAKVTAELKVCAASVNNLVTKRRQSAGARRGAVDRKGKLGTPEALRTEYERLLSKGNEPHTIAGTLADNLKVSPRAIRDKLKKTEAK